MQLQQTCRAAHDASILIHSLQELPYHEWHALDALHLLLCMKILLLQVALLILDVLLLNSKELELPLQSLLTHTDYFNNLQSLINVHLIIIHIRNQNQ
jgi:hypothetical protein